MTKKELYEYLDGYKFVNNSEIFMAVNDYFMEKYGILNPSYGELVEYGNIAEEYIKDRKIKFD